MKNKKKIEKLSHTRGNKRGMMTKRMAYQTGYWKRKRTLVEKLVKFV